MIIGNTVFHQSFIENSMDWAKASIDLAPDGALFLADQHGSTRGRQGRVWEQKEGQLLLTFVLKPQEHLPAAIVNAHLSQLGMAIALGFLNPLLAYNVTIKWPNDFVRDDKKVGGMLMESVIVGSELRAIIVGLGLNVDVTFAPEDPLALIATSLADPHKIDHAILMQQLMQSCDDWYAAWCAQSFDTIYTTWQDHNHYLGKKITVHLHDGSVYEGILRDVLPSGDALIENQAGIIDQVPFYIVDRITNASSTIHNT